MMEHVVSGSDENGTVEMPVMVDRQQPPSIHWALRPSPHALTLVRTSRLSPCVHPLSWPIFSHVLGAVLFDPFVHFFVDAEVRGEMPKLHFGLEVQRLYA